MLRVNSFSTHRLQDARAAGCEAVRGRHRPVIGAVLVMIMVMVVVAGGGGGGAGGGGVAELQ